MTRRRCATTQHANSDENTQYILVAQRYTNPGLLVPQSLSRGLLSCIGSKYVTQYALLNSPKTRTEVSNHSLEVPPSCGNQYVLLKRALENQTNHAEKLLIFARPQTRRMYCTKVSCTTSNRCTTVDTPIPQSKIQQSVKMTDDHSRSPAHCENHTRNRSGEMRNSMVHSANLFFKISHRRFDRR